MPNKIKSTKKAAPPSLSLNPFDRKIVKKKFQSVGTKLHQTERSHGQSRLKAFQTRKNTLLVEYKQNKKKNKFIDNRFGERNESMSKEDKMLARFQREKFRKIKKTNFFNIDDDETLTHKGQPLSDNLIDDYRESDDEDRGILDADTVNDAHFGGDFFQKKDTPGVAPERKSHKEIMAEVISKNKLLKAEKSREKWEREEEISRLDEDLPIMRQLLASRYSKVYKDSQPHQRPDDYDVLVRELLYEPRGTAVSRTKSPEELILEEKIRLEELEQDRIKRMKGIDLDDEDEDGGDEDEERKKSRSKNRHTSGDALEDFSGVPTPDEDEVEEDDQEQDKQDEDEEEDEEDEEDEEEEEDGEVDGKATQGVREAEEEEEEEEEEVGKKEASAPKKLEEVPFLIQVPETYPKFARLLNGHSPDNLKVILHRLLTTNHPSLDFKNKVKMEKVLGYEVKYFQKVVEKVEKKKRKKTRTPQELFEVLDVLTRSIFEVSQLVPTESANLFRSLLSSLYQSLQERLKDEEDKRKWLRPSELLVVKLNGVVFPVSDRLHPTITPAALLLAFSLAFLPVLNPFDLLSALFSSNLFFNYVEEAKRLAPEALQFLKEVIACLTGSTKTKFFTNMDASSSLVKDLALDRTSVKKTKKRKTETESQKDTDKRKLNLSSLFTTFQSTDDSEDTTTLKSLREEILQTSLNLLHKFMRLYSDNIAFDQLFSEIPALLQPLTSSPSTLSTTTYSREKSIEIVHDLEMFSNKVARFREPLTFLSEKPVPLRTYKPRFDMDFGKNLQADPNRERVTKKRLKKQVRSETKGAMRELRKDSAALFMEKRKEEDEKRTELEKKRNRVLHLLEDEQKGLNEFHKIKDSTKRRKKMHQK